MEANNRQLIRMPKINFEVNENDFAPVDISKLNRQDQVVGKPSKYIVDILKRFISNRWAVVFLVIFLLVILLAILTPPISYSLNGFSPIKAITDQVDTSVVINLPARTLGTNPSVTIYNATPSMIQTYETYGLITGTSNITPVVAGVAYKITYFPYEYTLQDGTQPLINVYPILGTDGNGIDIWTRLWAATETSLGLAFWVSILSILIGVVYGAVAGTFAGKWPDTIMMRFVEIVGGVPTIIWLLVLGAVLTASPEGTSSLSNSVVGFSLVFVLWFSPAITTRTYIMRNKDVEYVQATRTLGGSQSRIIFLHMIPVIAGRISVIFVNLIPTVIFFESSLVFLGLKPTSELGLGLLLYDAYTVSNVAQLVSPIVVFAAFTISAQIIANALNDAIDPRVVGR